MGPLNYSHLLRTSLRALPCGYIWVWVYVGVGVGVCGCGCMWVWVHVGGHRACPRSVSSSVATTANRRDVSAILPWIWKASPFRPRIPLTLRPPAVVALQVCHPTLMMTMKTIFTMPRKTEFRLWMYLKVPRTEYDPQKHPTLCRHCSVLDVHTLTQSSRYPELCTARYAKVSLASLGTHMAYTSERGRLVM